MNPCRQAMRSLALLALGIHQSLTSGLAADALVVEAPATNSPAPMELQDDILDIQPIVEIPVPWPWYYWALLVLSLLILAWGVRRWMNRPPAKAALPLPEPPHLLARRRLLMAADLMHTPEPFAVEVSDVIRSYLEARFHYRAPDRTTEEFLQELKASQNLSSDQKLCLADFLSRCDLVKFAGFEPDLPELKSLLRAAEQLVEETQPRPPSPSVEEALTQEETES